MSENNSVFVSGAVKADKTIGYLEITLKYTPEVLQSPVLSRSLATLVVDKYHELSGDPAIPAAKICILKVEATVAGSRVVQAVAKLYGAVRAGGGRMYCVGYPDKYITSLAALGLTGSEGFALFDAVEKAVEQAAFDLGSRRS